MFQTVLMLLAAGLIVQMVLWMRRHGRTLKRDLETALQRRRRQGQLVGRVHARRHRRGARRLRNRGLPRRNAVRGAQRRLCAGQSRGGGGLALAVATYGLLQLGGKILSWRLFFRVTEILLLLLAGALLLTAADNLVALGLLPRLSGPAVGRVQPAFGRRRFGRPVRLR